MILLRNGTIKRDATNKSVAYNNEVFLSVRPFLIIICSCIPPVENGPLRLDFSFTGFFLVLLLIVSRVDFIVFVLLLEGGWCEGVLLYSSRNRQAALCFALRPRATARRTLVPASWWLRAWLKAAKATFVELHSAEIRQSYSSRSHCWQHGIVTARCCRRAIHAAGEQN